MHPSSFYDLRACYVLTPLYGPYSLSEALEGLLCYPLNELRDSITISSKRTLRHELIFELSNVVDDLQEYLLYFSSKFLISPLNLPDFINELRAGYGRFEHLTVYWGALITRLIIACKIVERYFWPHFFHPSLDKQRPPLPNASWNKSFAPASASITSSQIVTPAFSATSPSPVQRLPLLNAHSESPLSTPSKANPTVDKDGSPSSWKLDATPTPPGLHPSASTSNTDAKEPGNAKNDAEAARIDEQINGEVGVAVEGEEVTTTSCATSPSTALQPTSTTRASAKTSPPSAASRFPSLAPYDSDPACSLHMIPEPSARLPLKRQRAKRSTSSPPFYALPTTQKPLSKAQPRSFGSSCENTEYLPSSCVT